MNPARLRLPRRSEERGGVSWVTLLLVGVLAVGGYLLWVWGPVWVVHYEVKQVVRDYANQAVKNRDDAQLVDLMCKKFGALDSYETVDQYGRPARLPVVDVRPQDVIWERRTDPPALHVAFAYTRPVFYPILDRREPTTFELDQTFDLARPDWGPAR